jgi:hypothetical protein
MRALAASTCARIGTLLVAVLAAPGAGWAAEATGRPSPVADELTSEGLTAYRARDYRQAAQKFRDAYALQPDPNLLFDLARCYQELGETNAAVEKYQAFLADPDGDPGARKRAGDALRALSATPTATAPEAPSLPNAAPPRASSAAGPRVDGRERGRGLTLPLVGIGSGVAVMGAGAVLYALGMRDHAEVTGADGYGSPPAVAPLTQVEAQRLVDSGRTKKLAGGIGLAVGGALAVASLALLFWPFEHGTGPESHGLALGVGAAAGQAGFSLQGRF